MRIYRKLEEDALARMGISSNLNEANLIRFLECMLGDTGDIVL